jgi:LysR family glycine cleavage system transcriptional activator
MSKAPLQALQSFVAAARLKNLSRAASALNVTVSALSHQMRALEERYGRRLLERGPRGVALTPDGERLYDALAPHFDAIERALVPLRSRRDDQLTISVMPSVASSWLVPRLPRFVAQHPHIELSVQSSIELVSFEREPIDAALRYGPGTWPGVVAEHLFDEWITPVAAPALIARHGEPTLATLGRFPLLGDPGDRWRAWFERFGGARPARFVAQFSDSEMLHKAAVEGIGVALGRVTMARPLIEAGLLRALTDTRLRAEFSHYLVYPPRSADHPALVAFRAWVHDEAKRYAAGLDAALRGPERDERPARRRAARGAARGRV